MIRLLLVSLGAPVAVALLWTDAPQWAIVGSWVAALALIGFAYTSGGLALKCPACGKRVKVGETHCHHCGRDVRSQV